MRTALVEEGLLTATLEIDGKRGGLLCGLLIGEASTLSSLQASGGSLRLGANRAVPLPSSRLEDTEVRFWAPSRVEGEAAPTVFVFKPGRGEASQDPSDEVRERLKTLRYVD